VKRKADGAGVRSNGSPRLIAGLALDTVAPDVADAILSSEISWTQTAHKPPVASRHSRIAIAAYYLSEARGFEPGHDEEDWDLAQLKIDDLDGRLS
jgi:Protein of unknown function (DUF2934)